MKAFVLFFLSALGAFAQQPKSVTLGYADTFEKLPKIAFEKITATDYEKYHDEQSLTHPQFKETKTQLLIPTKAGQVKLKKYKADDKAAFKGIAYKGYLPQLKMHVLTSYHTAEHIGFGDLFLIDSLTAYQYAIVSVGDDAVEIPIASPNGRALVYYYNEVYAKNSCFIGVLKVNSTQQPNTLLAEKMSFATKDWAVENIRWIDDRSFVVKTYTTKINGPQRAKDYNYFLAKIDTAK